MAQIVFWAALGLVVYAYAGFPLLLLIRGLFWRRAVHTAPITPSVSLVIVAHNEAATIAAKLENVFALDYPPDRLEVIVASDGSDDGTNELAAGFVARGLRLLAFPRSGKIPVLNAAAAQATGEILVFSDANSMFARDALRLLVAPFADPTVGAVGGNQVYVRDQGGGRGPGQAAGFGERLYWSYDRTLKTLQSRAGSMTAATGAIHAIRRELMRRVPLGVSDDFMISTGALEHGRRLVFAPGAIAYETVAPDDRAEFGRKLRVIVRGLRGLWLARSLFNPFRTGFYAVQLASHKLLRWSVCWLLVVLLAASMHLYDAGPVYRWLTRAQVAFYAAGLAGWALSRTAVARSKGFRVLAIPFYFGLANYAALRAWLQLLAGKRIDLWDSKRSLRAGSAT